jgi:hypothetical protein
MIELLGIASQKQMGKDALAGLLKDEMKGYEVSKVAFADGIKDSFCQLFNVDRDFIEKWKENPNPPPGWDMTVRKALQFIGDGFRGIKPLVWVDQAARTVEKGKWWKKIHVFSDIRYMNELKKTKEMGGFVILMFRPGHINDINHPSENQIRAILDHFIQHKVPEGPYSGTVECVDYFLINDGTLEDLRAKVINKVIPYLETKCLT